ncbi:SDR family oxidoreductase, partial [Rhizobium ruizarguesonis]
RNATSSAISPVSAISPIADLDKLVPYGRIGRPEEVAALVDFLASDEAAFMCGSLVEINGAQAVA